MQHRIAQDRTGQDSMLAPSVMSVVLTPQESQAGRQAGSSQYNRRGCLSLPLSLFLSCFLSFWHDWNSVSAALLCLLASLEPPTA